MRWLILSLALAGCDDFTRFPPDIGVDSGDVKFFDCSVLDPATLSITDELREPRTVMLRLAESCPEPHVLSISKLKLDDPKSAFEIVGTTPTDDGGAGSIAIQLRFIAETPGTYEAQLTVKTGFEGEITHNTQIFAELPAP